MTDSLRTAVEFLLRNGFSMDTQCKSGVPYLSREEEKEAIAKATEKSNHQATKKFLEIEESDQESLEFVQAVRQIVDSWLAQGVVCLCGPKPSQRVIDLLLPEQQLVGQHSTTHSQRSRDAEDLDQHAQTASVQPC